MPHCSAEDRMTARRRRRGTAVQDTPEIGDSKHAGSRRSESPALRFAKPRRSLPLRRARFRGSPLSLRGSPSQVIVMGSNIHSENEEAGAVSLLSLDEAVNEADEADEDESTASLPRSGRDSCAAGYMELVFNDSTGLWDWELVQPKKASRWLIGVQVPTTSSSSSSSYSQFQPPGEFIVVSDPDSCKNERLTISMGTGKKAAEPRSQPTRNTTIKRTRRSTAKATISLKPRSASPQAIRSSRAVKKKRLLSSSSGDESSDASDDKSFDASDDESFDASDEYTPSSYTSPSVAAEVESEADTSEGVDFNPDQGVADTEEDSDSDRHTTPPSKRRRVETPDAPEASTRSQTGKTVKPNVIGAWKFKPGIDANLPPISDVREIFEDITQKAVNMAQFSAFIERLGARPLNVATMCSGTESPLLALRLIRDALGKNHNLILPLDHQFSAEIVPFKQAYIERNFHPKILFRDINELAHNPEASTAYGAPVSVPRNVDILIAGFSCVDFSRLNSNTKDVEADGESGDTLRAILAYAKEYRPPIIVLENVNGAPWQDIKKKWQKIEYAADFVKLDTKQYYIPHTRQRVYMVCIDKQKSKSADASIKKWGTLMQQFQRPASCSIDAFLLDSDDPRLQAAREQLAKSSRGEDRGPREVEWTKCQGRHQNYRTQMQLGDERPVTAWVNKGSCKTPEFGWHEWNKKQVERIWDTVDMSYLRNAQRGYDSHYKLRVWELSQNIDRFTDTAPFGVTGCITPTGQPFVTTRGGPLLGLESVGLQGIPFNQLILTRETQKQLQDLAGNAMSITPVGIAIVCALMVGYPALAQGPEKTPSPDKQLPLIIMVMDVSALREIKLDLSSYKPRLVSELSLMAQCSIRLCLCEGATSITTKRLLVCQQCEHTACERCAGIPKHFYRYLGQSQISVRKTPHEFEKAIKDSLPMRLHLLNLDSQAWGKAQDLALGTIKPVVWTIFMDAVRDVCKQELRFQAAKRTHFWTVTYDAPRARLELVFFDSKAQWYLYAKPDSGEPVNSIVRLLLKYPIARMMPKDNNLLEGPWEIRLPLKTSLPIIIEGGGTLTESWESQLGLQDPKFVNKKIWNFLQITTDSKLSERLHLDIAGEYELLQECGGASGSLHKRISDPSKSKPPLYLFLDVEPIGDPKDDKFVFSTEIQRQNWRDARTIVASVSSSWRQSSVEGPESVQCDIHGEWIHTDAILQAFEHTEPATYSVLRQDTFKDGLIGKPEKGLGSASCTGATTAILSCKVPLVNDENIGWRSGPWMVVDETRERLFYTSFSWLTEKVRSLDAFESKWELLELPEKHVKCQGCAPDEPDLKWMVIKSGRTDKIVPIEDARQAGQYERAMKARVTPFVTHVRIDDDKVGRLMIGLNIPTLAHRALAKLPDLGSYDGVSLYWRLNTGYTWPSKFDLPRFKITDNRNDPEEDHVFPAEAEVDGVTHKLRLRKEQLRSLNWMIRQEADGAKPFVEQEVEEAVLQHLGWRAEVRARRTRRVRGGILADEVGYGKTATSLALIDAQAKAAQAAKAAQGAKAGPETEQPCVGAFLIKATLIVVPRQLVPQWKKQVAKFLGETYKVIVIQEPRNLTTQTIQSFQEADIVIVTPSVFTADPYLQKLSLFAALPEAPATAGRALDVWLARAIERISGHVEQLKAAKPTSKFADHLGARLNAAETDEELLRQVPSKRLRGKVYAAASAARKEMENKENNKKRKLEEQDNEVETEPTEVIPRSMAPVRTRDADAFGISKAKSISQISNLVFQMFRFNRLIIDEYTYVDAKAYAFMTSLQASSRWVLSGTPPLDDFADVKTMAGFLGANLGIDEDTVGVLKGENIRAIRKDRTAAEHFHSYDRRVQSPEWHTQRHAHAQSFLDQFARKNTAEIDEIVTNHELKAVNLPAAERAVYAELQQHVIAQDMKLRDGGKVETDNDRQRRINELMRASKSPQEALLKCPSLFKLISREEVLLASQSIVRTRKKHQESLCKKLRDHLKEAARLMPLCKSRGIHYTSWEDHVRDNGFGDPEATKSLMDMIYTAGTHVDSSDEQDFDREPPIMQKKKDNLKATANLLRLRNLAGVLRSDSDKLVSRTRALRFFTAVCGLQLWQAQGTPVPPCASCGHKAAAPEKIIVLTLCGHVICDNCLAAPEPAGNCVVMGCRAEAFDYYKIKACELRHKDRLTGSAPYYGKKLEEVIQLIKGTPAEDQVLLFVQFDDLMEKVKEALEQHGITHYALTEKASKHAPKWMNDFQTKTDETKKKVLVLNSANESAAGANLTNANHIIFVSPLLAPSQHQYDESLTQCIGRARRYGQKKVVYVYRFLSLKTIDVDIMQKRSGRKLVELQKDNFELLDHSDVPPELKGIELGSGFVMPDDVTEEF